MNSQFVSQKNIYPSYSTADIEAMKEWILDCVWEDIENEDDIHIMSDEQILAGIERNYSGGVAQFLADGK